VAVFPGPSDTREGTSTVDAHLGNSTKIHEIPRVLTTYVCPVLDVSRCFVLTHETGDRTGDDAGMPVRGVEYARNVLAQLSHSCRVALDGPTGATPYG